MRDPNERDVLGTGSVVVSTAGRDKKRVFVVTDVTVESGRIMLTVADGALRRCADGKRKNARHVRQIAAVTEDELEKLKASPDDGFVKKLIGKYDPLNKAGSSEESRPERGGGEN
ncbi:MAG: hypothetical protein IKN50_05710 [Clostridia bacterium]|nr:hypothetical protein [Clostridia bacterium]